MSVRPAARAHFVYMVRCADGSLYTGYARDPARREQAHNAGRGARYTSGRRPVCLVYIEQYESVGNALRRERELKGWSKARKETAIMRGPSARSLRKRLKNARP